MQGIDPFAIPAGMNNPLYPMAGYDNSRELDHDMSMMKEMYPLLVRPAHQRRKDRDRRTGHD